MIKEIKKYFPLKRHAAPSFSIPRFILVFILLAGSFYAYVGITSPGGKTYLPFLDHYFNLTEWLTWLIAKTALFILKLCGFAVYQRAPNNITIIGSRGVTILWACLGFGVMSFWTAFVVAHRAAWQFKFSWCLKGIVFITILNITRIILIAVANHYHWEHITSLEPHQTFNIASYILLFVLMAWFIRRYKQYEMEKALQDNAALKNSRVTAIPN